MNKNVLSFSLSALALLSIAAGNAQAGGTYSIQSNLAPGVMTQSAVLENSAVIAPVASPMTCAPLFGKLTHFENEPVKIKTESEMLGYDGMRVNTFARVIPSSDTTRICGQRLSNSLFDVRLFGFGLGLGKVNPHYDKRPAGQAF